MFIKFDMLQSSLSFYRIGAFAGFDLFLIDIIYILQMSKTIKKLEKENLALRKKSEKSDVTLIELVDEVFILSYVSCSDGLQVSFLEAPACFLVPIVLKYTSTQTTQNLCK